MFCFQEFYQYGSYVQCHFPFTKEGSVFLLILCFAIPVLVNGFCHISIAVALAKSIKAEKQLTDKLVLLLAFFILNTSHNVCPNTAITNAT